MLFPFMETVGLLPNGGDTINLSLTPFIVTYSSKVTINLLPLKLVVPLSGTDLIWVPSLVDNAKSDGRFIAAKEVDTPLKRASKLRPGHIFVIKGSDPPWTHTGFVLAVNEKSFGTIEGNVGGDSGVNGPNARQGNYAYGDKDFLRLL